METSALGNKISLDSTPRPQTHTVHAWWASDRILIRVPFFGGWLLYKGTLKQEKDKGSTGLTSMYMILS